MLDECVHELRLAYLKPCSHSYSMPIGYAVQPHQSQYPIAPPRRKKSARLHSVSNVSATFHGDCFGDARRHSSCSPDDFDAAAAAANVDDCADLLPRVPPRRLSSVAKNGCDVISLTAASLSMSDEVEHMNVLNDCRHGKTWKDYVAIAEADRTASSARTCQRGWLGNGSDSINGNSNTACTALTWMKGCSSIGEWQAAAHVRPGKEIDYKIVEKDLGMLGDELCCTSGAACAVEKRLNGPDELCIRPIVQSNVEPLNEQRPSYASASGQDKLGLMTGRSSISDDSLLDDNATSATPDGFGQLSEMTSRHANDDDDSIVDVSDESTAEERRRLSLSSDSDCDDDSLDIDSFVKSWQKRTECKGNESQTGAKKPHNLINAGDICHIADNLPSYLCVSSNILMTDDASTSSQQNNVKKRNDVISTDTSTNKRSQECDERLDNLLFESNCSTDVKSGEQNEEQLLKVFEVAAAKTISDDISDRFSNSNDASVGANAVGSSDNGCGNPSMTASRWRPQQPLTMWNQGDLMAYCGDLLAWQQRYRQERLQRRHLQPSQQHHQKRRNGFAKANIDNGSTENNFKCQTGDATTVNSRSTFGVNLQPVDVHSSSGHLMDTRLRDSDVNNDVASEALTTSGPDVQPSAEANGGGWKATRTENGFISSSHEENTARSSSSESDVTGGYPRDNKVSLQQPAETSKQMDFFKREADEYGSSQSPLLTLCHIDLLDCAVETDSCTKVSADHPESTTLSDGTNGRAFASPRNDSLPNDETETANRELLTSVNVTCGGQSIRDVAMSSHSFENNRAVDCSKSRATGANERHFSPVPGLFRDAERDNRPIVDVQEDCKEDSGRGMLSRSTDVIKKTDVGESHQQYIISPQSVTASCRSSASPTVVSSQSSTGQCQVRLPVTVAIQRTEAKENRASSIEEATCTRADKAAGERTVDNGTPETEGAAVDDSRSDCHVTKLAGQLQRLSRHTINNKLKGLRVTPVESSPMTSSSSSLPSSSATMSPTGSSSHPAAVASCSSYSSDRCPSSKPQVELPLIVSVIGGASLRLPNTAAVRLSTALLPKPFLLRQSSSPFSPSSSSYRPIVRPVTSSSSPQSVTQSRDRSSSCVNGVANICPPEVAGSPPQESNLEYRADTPKDGAGVSCDFPSAVRVDATVNEPHRQCDKQDVGNRSTGISGWQNMNANDDFQSSSLFPCNSGCTPSTKSASNLAEVQSANPEMSSKSRISSTVKRCWQSSLPVWTPRPFQSVISPTVTSPSNSSPIRPAKLVGAVTETDFSQVSSEKRPVDVSVAGLPATTFRPSARNAPPATVTPATELFFDAVTTLSPVTPSSVQRSPVQPAVLGSRCHDQQQLSPTATADRDRGSKAVSPVVWVESCEQNSSSTSPPAVGLSALRALSAVLREQDNDEMTIISTVHRTRGNPTTTNRQGPSSAPAMAATATVAKVAAVRDLMPEVTLKTGRSIGRPLIDAVKPESNHTTSASELSVHTSKDAACKVTSTANEVKLKPAKEVNADKCVDLADCFGLNKPEDNPRELISATEETGVKLQVSMLKGAFGVGFCIEGGTDSPTGSSPVKVKRIFKADCCLRQGDVIESVNGTSFAEISHFDAWKFLKSLPPGEITFCVNRK